MSRKLPPVRIQVGPYQVTIRVSDSAEAVSGTPKQRPKIERDILSVATKEPLPARTLARLAAKKYGPYFRAAVAKLVKTGELKRHGNNDLSLP